MKIKTELNEWCKKIFIVQVYSICPGVFMEKQCLPIEDVQDDIARRDGNIRGISLKKNFISTDRIYGLSRSIGTMPTETFGMTPHEVQLETDRRSYEPIPDTKSIFWETDEGWAKR